jgi:hypothetical protein
MMEISKVKELKPLDLLLYFIRERHSIYLKKVRRDRPPWTNDEILQSIYFTNPYRENDKTTVWYRQNIGDSIGDDPRLIFATSCFRWFNLISTGEELIKHGLLYEWDSCRAVQLMEDLRKQGKQVFTSAFNISNSDPKKTKLNGVCEDYIQSVWDNRDKLMKKLPNKSLAVAFNILGSCKGFGGSGFMNAQVVCDLKYTPLLSAASDWDTWCSPGPGSKKGLSILLGREEKYKYSQVEFMDEVNKIRIIVEKRLNKMPPLHAQDIQNCLCEFFKYNRVLNGGGTRRRYNAEERASV